MQFNPISSSSLVLTWSLISSDTPCGTVTAPFKVQWKKTNQMTINVKYVNGTSTTITGLNPRTEYEFKISSCANKNDKSLWSQFRFPNNQIVENNDTEVFDDLREHLNLSFLNRTSVNLSWYDDSVDANYVVCYVEANKGCEVNTCKGDMTSSR